MFCAANLYTTIISVKQEIGDKDLLTCLIITVTLNCLSGVLFTMTLYHIAGIQLEYQIDDTQSIVYTPSEASESIMIGASQIDFRISSEDCFNTTGNSNDLTFLTADLLMDKSHKRLSSEVKS